MTHLLKFKLSSSGSWRLTVLPEDGGSMDPWNLGILSQHYMVSQPRRSRLESSPPWKAENSYQNFSCRIMCAIHSHWYITDSGYENTH
jgi:hypothetical protein